MTPALLDVRDLKKHYTLPGSLVRLQGRYVIRAVDGVSFSLGEGETIGLVGESGCGKTTTARMLLRLDGVTDGKIVFGGEEVQQATGPALRRYRQQVQAVFQDPYSSLNPRMRVYDILAEPLEVVGELSRERVDARVGELLALVGLAATAAGKYPHEFSGGQRQRIAIARGLALHPRLLILDEPVSSLDVSIRAQILNLLQDLQERLRISYVLISHDLDVVAHMCAVIAVMYLGRIVEIGPSAELRRAPRHPYTQALFSAKLPTHPDLRHERIRLSGEIPSPFAPPAGCTFHTRCPRAMEICEHRSPVSTTFPGNSAVSCHLFGNS